VVAVEENCRKLPSQTPSVDRNPSVGHSLRTIALLPASKGLNKMVSTPSGRWHFPALPHDQKEKRFIAIVFVCILLLTRLYNNHFNLSSRVVNVVKSRQQHERQRADFLRNNSSPLTAATLLQMPLSSSIKVHKLSPNLKDCPNTMVTAYFQIRSKRTTSHYLKWMTNMLSLQDCMIIMTTSSMVKPTKDLRQHAMDGTVIIEMEIDDLPISYLHAEQDNPEFWSNQLDIDREKKLHQSYQLFWIWLSKTWFVVQAIQKDYFHSSFYMWQDIGSYRNSEVSSI
jgi:hypothetical protein